MKGACSVLCCHLWLVRLYNFSHISKQHDLKKNVIGDKTCFDFLYSVCLKHFSYETLNELLSQMYTGLHVKCPLLLSDLIKPEFSRQIFKKYSYQISWKSVQWELASVGADRQTDRQTDAKKLVVAFRSFVNKPKKYVCRPRLPLRKCLCL
jgi:hypothetical protein